LRLIRVRAEAQAEAAKIRTDAHVATAWLRDQVIRQVRTEMERACEQLAAQLQTACARRSTLLR